MQGAFEHKFERSTSTSCFLWKIGSVRIQVEGSIRIAGPPPTKAASFSLAIRIDHLVIELSIGRGRHRRVQLGLLFDLTRTGGEVDRAADVGLQHRAADAGGSPPCSAA
jgi:hypothetical protein